MFTILVPTDYSENASHALQYAIQLTTQDQIRLVVVHVGEILVLTSTPPHLYKETFASYLKEKNDELQQYVSKIVQKSKAEISPDIYFSDGSNFLEQLDKAVEKFSADLIVMGTKGASGIKKLVMGSNTVKTMEHLKIPVIAVPESSPIQLVHTIGYASDLKMVNKEVSELIKIAGHLKLKIDIFHIHPNYPEWIQPNDETLNDTLANLNKEFPTQKLTIRLIKTENENQTTEGIKSYVNVVKPDILAMFPTQRNFIEKLFNPGNTEEIAFEAAIPLLSVPS